MFWLVMTTSLVGACAGGTTATTTADNAAPSTTLAPSATTAGPATTTGVATTSAPATTAGNAPVTSAAGGMSEEAQACLETVHDWIVAIEDDAGAVDFETVSFHDYQLFLVQIVPSAQAMIDEFQERGCLTIDQEALDPASQDVIQWAEVNAPGAVEYLELQQADEELDVVGDCVSDVEAMQAYVDGGGTVMDLSVRQRIHTYNLAGSIIQWCSLEVGERFVSSAEVSAFLEIED
jgi:hypothetical protein